MMTSLLESIGYTGWVLHALIWLPILGGVAVLAPGTVVDIVGLGLDHVAPGVERFFRGGNGNFSRRPGVKCFAVNKWSLNL